jgi:hypothetical protein
MVWGDEAKNQQIIISGREEMRKLRFGGRNTGEGGKTSVFWLGETESQNQGFLVCIR